MNVHLKVQPHHLERGAYLYIRQSSMRQVVENVESARRQYALRGALSPLDGATSRLSSSTTIKESPVHRPPGVKGSSAW